LPDLSEYALALSSRDYCAITIEDGFLPIAEPDYKIGDFISEYLFDALARTLDGYRQSGHAAQTDYLIGVVNHAIQRNYFSIARDDYSCVVASIADIEQLLGAVTLLEFLVLEIAQYAVAAIEKHEWHSEPRRCLFDFCGDKRDIVNSLRYRSLCSSCETRISSSGKAMLAFAAQIANRNGVATNMQKVLFVSADPSDASRLKIQREHREIKQEMQMSAGRGCFEFDCHLALRPADLSRALLQVPRPIVLHFSGHGTSGAGALCLEDETGHTQSVTGEAIAALLSPIASQLSCVILNSCYSEVQASAILKHVPYVVVMSDAIGDDAAIAYSVGFYQGLFNHEAIPTAHALGCAQIQLRNQHQQHVPKLHCRDKKTG